MCLDNIQIANGRFSHSGSHIKQFPNLFVLNVRCEVYVNSSVELATCIEAAVLSLEIHLIAPVFFLSRAIAFYDSTD